MSLAEAAGLFQDQILNPVADWDLVEFLLDVNESRSGDAVFHLIDGIDWVAHLMAAATKTGPDVARTESGSKVPSSQGALVRELAYSTQQSNGEAEMSDIRFNLLDPATWCKVPG